MSSNITALLNDIGMDRPRLRPQQKEVSINERLSTHGLDLDDMLPRMAEIINDDDVLPSTKLAAIRDVLKMHGVLKENPASAITPVTIVINEPSKSNNTAQAVNVILVPRELQPTF